MDTKLLIQMHAIISSEDYIWDWDHQCPPPGGQWDGCWSFFSGTQCKAIFSYVIISWYVPLASYFVVLELFLTWCFKHARIPVGTHSQNNIYCLCCIILFLLMINLSPVNDVDDWLKPHKFQPILKYVTMVDPITGWF